jgi:hypothetical protein
VSRAGFVVDHGVEALADEEAGAAVEVYGWVVGFGDGKGDGVGLRVGEVAHGVMEQRRAEPMAAPGPGHAELGDVGDVLGDTGAEEEADEGSGVLVANDPGVSGLEGSASGEADDVVEEAQRAVEGTVLVINLRIDVVGVRVVNERGRSLVEVRGPGDKLSVFGQRRVGGAVDLQQRCGAEIVLHEETRMRDEAGFEERAVQGSGVVEEELRFNAMNAGRVEEELEEPVEESEIGLAGEVGIGGEGPGIADDGFIAFIDAEGVSADAAAVEGDKAREDAGVEVLKEKLCRGPVVPAEALLPFSSLSLKERTKLASGEVPQIEDLELGGYSHGRAAKKASVEIIGNEVRRARDSEKRTLGSQEGWG